MKVTMKKNKDQQNSEQQSGEPTLHFRVGSATVKVFNAAVIIYSIYKLIPKFDKFKGIDTDHLVAGTKKPSRREDNYDI